jgi:3-methylfumaryl-CoA hydratase
MWAAGRVQFQLPVALGATVARRSTIMSVTGKSGRSGPMIFVTLRHEVLLGESVAVLEEQDIVYRGAALLDAGRSPPADNSGRRSDNSRRIIVDSVQLFRFSALTYNAHRIHYDRNYAREVEGYPGLVVHGPYIAMLLMDHFLRQAPARRVLSFNFRAERPLFDNSALDLCLSPTAAGADLWAADTHGATALSATIICD